MKYLLQSFLLISAAALPAIASDLATLQGPNLSNYLERELPEGVEVQYIPSKDEAPDVLRVACSTRAPTSVPLFRIPVDLAPGTEVYGVGEIRGEDVQGKACFELWCQTGGGSFFSRALDTGLIGTTGWARHRAPFFLKPGQKADSYLLGVRFEGPGTVYVRSVALYASDGGFLGFLQRPGAWGGLLGAVVGVLGGCWGGLAGALAPKGKGRGLVVGMGYLLLLIGIALAVAGGVLLLGGAPRDQWYALLLSGGILTVVMLSVLPMVRRRYREAEERQMRQVDAGEGL